MEDNSPQILRPCAGYSIDISTLMQLAKILVEMGYTVKRTKVFKPGCKTKTNALLYVDEGGEKDDQSGA